MKTIDVEALDGADVLALLEAPDLAFRAATWFVERPLTHGAEARRADGSATTWDDVDATALSIDGAIERAGVRIGAGERVVAWVVRAFRMVTGASPAVAGEAFTATAARAALIAAGELLDEWGTRATAEKRPSAPR